MNCGALSFSVAHNSTLHPFLARNYTVLSLSWCAIYCAIAHDTFATTRVPFHKSSGAPFPVQSIPVNAVVNRYLGHCNLP